MKRLAISSALCLLLGLLPFVAGGCGGGGGSAVDPDPFVGEIPDDTPQDRPPTPPEPTPPPPAPPSPPGSTTTQPRVPLGSTPPVGLTWHIGFTENVSMSQLQSLYGQAVALGSALWSITEGQVYLYKVKIKDNVGPGTTPSAWEANHGVIATSDLDLLIWPSNVWDLPGTNGVVWWSSPAQFGRTGLVMLLPSNASTHTWIHETGHFVWNLSWPISFGLEDEYIDGIQDPACVMESTNPPRRWCSDANHVNQLSQPHACWHQILLDYANYTHNDVDYSTTPAWTPLVTYEDTP